jgi:hypothetical protein
MTHDELAAIIEAEYPGAKHGADFMVGMAVDDVAIAEHGTDAFIVTWGIDDSPPDDTAIAALADKHAMTLAVRASQRRRDAVTAHSEARIAAGAYFHVDGLADPVLLTGRPDDRTVYHTLLTRAEKAKAAGVTDPIHRMRDGDNVMHQLTPDQVIELIEAGIAWFEQVKATSWDMKDGTGDFPDGVPADFTDDSHWPARTPPAPA